MNILIEELKEKLPENAFHFADFPEVVFFDEFSDHLETLEGAEIVRFEVDGIIEVWIEFTYANQYFYVNNQFGDYKFIVRDPKTPELILLEIANHFRSILEKNDESQNEVIPNQTGEDIDIDFSEAFE